MFGFFVWRDKIIDLRIKYGKLNIQNWIINATKLLFFWDFLMILEVMKDIQLVWSRWTLYNNMYLTFSRKRNYDKIFYNFYNILLF